jgi:hypothetical protein
MMRSQVKLMALKLIAEIILYSLLSVPSLILVPE